MGTYIIADNQELTRFALESLIRQHEENVVFRATDKAGLTDLLKQHELLPQTTFLLFVRRVPRNFPKLRFVR